MAAFSAEVLAWCRPAAANAGKARVAEDVDTLTPLVELVALAASAGWTVGAFGQQEGAFHWKREANEVVAKFAKASQNPSYCALLNYAESDRAGERRLDTVVLVGATATVRILLRKCVAGSTSRCAGCPTRCSRERGGDRAKTRRCDLVAEAARWRMSIPSNRWAGPHRRAAHLCGPRLCDVTFSDINGCMLYARGSAAGAGRRGSQIASRTRCPVT